MLLRYLIVNRSIFNEKWAYSPCEAPAPSIFASSILREVAQGTSNIQHPTSSMPSFLRLFCSLSSYYPWYFIVVTASISYLCKMYYLLSSHLLCHFFWSVCLFSSSTWAQQTIQQLLWKIPDENQPDFSTTFTEGNTVPLAWNALVTISFLDTTKNLVDLWVTAFDSNVDPVAQRILRRCLR